MADLQKNADDLSSLTVIEAAELSKILEEKWGVSAAAMAAPVASGGAGGSDAAPAAEAKTEFAVHLTAAGAQKINVIKEICNNFIRGVVDLLFLLRLYIPLKDSKAGA